MASDRKMMTTTKLPLFFIDYRWCLAPKIAQATDWCVISQLTTKQQYRSDPSLNQQFVLRLLLFRSGFSRVLCEAVAVYTGMRQGEILGLHRGDINLEKGVVNVRHQISAIHGQGLAITEPESEKARQPITLSQRVLDI